VVPNVRPIGGNCLEQVVGRHLDAQVEITPAVLVGGTMAMLVAV
jgi:hypothetical protein